MPNIRLIITDVDGTLVGSDFEVSPRVRHAIAEARRRGAEIALCTGRPESSCRRYIEELQLSGYHIFDAGATIADPLAGVTLFSRTIDRELAHQILHYGREHQIFLEVYGDGGYYVEHLSEHGRIHAALQHLAPAVGDLSRVLDRIQVSKMEAVALDDDEAARIRAMLDHFATQIDSGWAGAPGISTRFANILPRGVSKGEAVKRLIAEAGLAVEQVLGVGDGPNDEPLLHAVGIGVAMGDAYPPLKRVAGWVTAPVGEDGLALAIEHFVLAPTPR